MRISEGFQYKFRMFLKECFYSSLIFPFKYGTCSVNQHPARPYKSTDLIQQILLKCTEFPNSFLCKQEPGIRISPPSSGRTAWGIHKNTIAQRSFLQRWNLCRIPYQPDILKTCTAGASLNFLQLVKTNISGKNTPGSIHHRSQFQRFPSAACTDIPPYFTFSASLPVRCTVKKNPGLPAFRFARHQVPADEFWRLPLSMHPDSADDTLP